MRNLRRLLVLAALAAVLWVGWRFAGSNSGPVSVDYLFGRAEDVSLWLALVVAFALGALVSGTLGVYQVAKLGLLARRYRKAASGLESEIHQLRNLPLASDAERPPRSSAGSVPELGGPSRTAERGV
jgi:uncharacterized integral membrane protein